MKRAITKKIILTAAAFILSFVNVIPPAMAGGIQVKSVEISGLENISEDVVRDVINIRPGDEFSTGAVELAKENLAKWGIFAKAEDSYTTEQGGVVISFDMEEGDVAASIEMDGNYPYLENKIRKYLTLHTGDIYTQELLLLQAEKIKDFYKREGYAGTEVSISEEALPEWGGAVITFHIHRGSELRIRSIKVDGNRAYPAGKFVSVINPHRIFSERRFNDSIRKLREFYQSHGYPKARIKVISKTVNIERHEVGIELSVSEGPYVDLVFKGAPHISRRLFRKTVTVAESGSIDHYETRKSAAALEKLLKDRGYPNAKVGHEKEEMPDGSILLTFSIDEGLPQKIKRIRFTGNRGVRDFKLLSGMKNREMAIGSSGAYHSEDIAYDNEAILSALKSEGFLDAKIGEWEVKPTKQGHALEITIPVEEGTRTIVREISFDGNRAFKTPALLKELELRPGKPFNAIDVERESQRIHNFYADNGYPYAEVTQRVDVDPATSTAVIRYDVNEGALVHIGRMLFIGDVLTSQKAIRNAMTIREGDIFSYRRILESQLNIRRLGAFAAVSVEALGLEEKSGVVHLKVKVEEQKPFLVDMGVDYSTINGLTGTLSFANVNAFGWAKSNTFKLTGGRKFSRAEMGWFDPRFVSSAVEMSSSIWLQYQQRPAYTYTQYGGAIGWFRRYRRFGFYTRYNLERDYFVEGDTVAANADSLRNNTISKISLTSDFNTRDNFSDPKKGFYTLGGVIIYNEIQGNNANFVRFSWQGESNISFVKDFFTMTSSFRFDRIQTMGSNVAVPPNEMLFLGGDYTIRGFSEDSLGPQNANGRAVGGTTRWIENEELRMRLLKTLSFAIFFDMGSLTNTFSQIDSQSIRESIGLGLRYITPVGPIRADYGFKLDKASGEPVGRFHLTFGYVF